MKAVEAVATYSQLCITNQGLLDDEPGDAPHLREVGIAVAHIYERRLDAWEPGARAYRRVLSSPGNAREDLALFAGLEALLTRHGRWAELAEVYAEAVDTADDDARRRDLHARKAVVAEVRLGDVDAVGFGRGPGAFTGLRSACSVAQGLALGIGCPQLAIDSLALVAEDARSQHGAGAQDLWVAMDARMDEAYAAAYCFDAIDSWRCTVAPALCAGTLP